LLEAAAKALKVHPLELRIIGDGQLRPALEAQSRALGISDRVTFTGFLQQEECAQQLADSDALVLPSLYECGGAVVLEAMAMGLPVVATRWGGPADYLDDETGILVEPRGEAPFVEALAAALVRLAESWELRRQLGQAGRERVKERFDWERKIDRIIEIYRQAQARSHSASAPRAL
jgi:glycosyltransferase involved in cell wall biosynthesis